MGNWRENWDVVEGCKCTRCRVQRGEIPAPDPWGDLARMSTRLLLFGILCLVVVLAICAVVSRARSAPAPKPRPVQLPPTVAGRWTVTGGAWGGSMEFQPGGAYVHTWDECVWVGRWRVLQGRLEVEEQFRSRDGGLGRVQRWQGSLERSGAGWRISFEGDYDTGVLILQPPKPDA